MPEGAFDIKLGPFNPKKTSLFIAFLSILWLAPKSSIQVPLLVSSADHLRQLPPSAGQRHSDTAQKALSFY